MDKNSIARKLPVEIKLPELSKSEFIAYHHENRSEINNILLTVGAIKFKGVLINSIDDFEHTVNSISDRFMNYIDGNSPRTKLSGTVYTSTEYDNTQKITMHNELSYSARWPARLFFSCIETAQTGGETFLADSRDILKEMDKEIVKEIEQRGIKYIRNLHSGVGVGPTWQETFETNSPNDVEVYCKKRNIQFEWAGDFLKIIQNSKGIINHRITGEKIWFNQIDQFHPSHLGKEVYETIQLLYDEPANFPMYVQFADGGSISESMIDEVLKTIEKLKQAPKWQPGELLILDNELVCHGRNAYTGNRKVLVAMTE